MSRPRLSIAEGTALTFLLSASLGLLPGIAPEPKPTADVVAFVMWALVLMSAVELGSSEPQVQHGEEPERRCFEYKGVLRGL